ncbi:ABC transporter substrate-binding protein [Oerskovia sp. NPDC057915]|uniref:ABC transporter substrate-binding protein n=1 Tax=Oerskovia sp. NPDC057915 TaxID=3346280 RepID=UPI0036DE0593
MRISAPRVSGPVGPDAPTAPDGSRARSTRRTVGSGVAAALALVLALAACSSPDGDATPDTVPGETRTVQDALGAVEVPVDPQRIVSTDFFSSSVLVDVGIVPVGVMSGIDEPNPAARPNRYFDALGDVPAVSTYAEINVEKVLDLAPDLIIVDSQFSDPETIERLATIAPIFNVDLSGSWSERALSIADAANRLDEVTAQKADYDARVAEISTAYRDVLDGRRFAVLALHPTEATWSAYLPGSWPTPVWVDLGATFRETTDGESTDDSFVWLPDEQLEKLSNADVVLVVDTEQLPRMEANGLWTSLPAVTDGLALPNVKASATSSFLWGLDNLDDAEEILQKVQATA